MYFKCTYWRKIYSANTLPKNTNFKLTLIFFAHQITTMWSTTSSCGQGTWCSTRAPSCCTEDRVSNIFVAWLCTVCALFLCWTRTCLEIQIISRIFVYIIWCWEILIHFSFLIYNNKFVWTVSFTQWSWLIFDLFYVLIIQNLSRAVTTTTSSSTTSLPLAGTTPGYKLLNDRKMM